MPNQYTKLTVRNVTIKMYRQNNPVTSITQMAREFNMPRTSMQRWLKRNLSMHQYSWLTRKTAKFSNA